MYCATNSIPWAAIGRLLPGTWRCRSPEATSRVLRGRHASANQGMLRHPAIVSTFASDLYISPLQEDAPERLSWADSAKEFRLRKGEQAEIDGLAVKFVGFDMSQHLGENVMAVGATLEVSNISSGHALGSVTRCWASPQVGNRRRML